MWIKSFSIKNYIKRNSYKHIIRQYGVKKYKPPWRVMFFGTDIFSLPSLKILTEQYKYGNLVNKLDVVTSIKFNNENELQRYASKEKLDLHNWPVDPLLIRDQYDIGIISSFGHLIPENIINAFPLGMINVHASLLPRWRGAAPIVYSIMAGDDVTGVTIMKVAPKKFDIGEIILQKRIKVLSNVTQPELTEILADLGSKALLETIENLPDCLEQAIPQPNIGITYAPKLNASVARIQWSTMDSKKILNMCRALKDLYPLHCFWEGRGVKLLDIQVLNGTDVSEQTTPYHVTNMPGYSVFSRQQNQLRIQSVDGKWIVPKRLVVTGRKPMSGRDFYNGFMSRRHPKFNVFS